MTTPTVSANSHITLMNRPYGAPRFHFDENAGGAGDTSGAAKPWHDGAPPEALGFWNNKGLTLDNPKDFAVKLTDMYRNAEKMIGAPPDQVLKLPKADASPEDKRAFYERLGAPKEAKEYDLAAVKDAELAEAMRTVMHQNGVPKEAATTLAQAIAKQMEAKAAADSAVAQAKITDEKTSLRKNWGDKFDFNHLQAIEGARRLGITPEGVAALESQIGYSAVMEAFRKIGANTREDTFVERGAGGPVGEVTTLEGAQERKRELMADPAWVTKYNNGDPAAKREMTRLNQMITGATA